MSENKADITNEPQIPTNMEGWSWFEEQAKANEAETIDEKQIEEEMFYYHFRKAFSTPSGKFVFDHLEKFMDKFSDFDPELGFYNGASYGFYRQGQKSIVMYIKKLIKGKPNVRK